MVPFINHNITITNKKYLSLFKIIIVMNINKQANIILKEDFVAVDQMPAKNLAIDFC